MIYSNCFEVSKLGLLPIKNNNNVLMLNTEIIIILFIEISIIIDLL